MSLTDGSTPMFFNDVLFNPLHMETLSAVILEAVDMDLVGTYNVGASTSMTKAEFAVKVGQHMKVLTGQTAIGPSNYRVPRPKDLRMDISKLEEKGFKMPTLEQEIKRL
jgi:dTDP-4-dehydrorhamnose reductase